MSEVLSQSQIDALLNSLNSDSDDSQEIQEQSSEKKYQKYDFYSPKKFNKDKLKIVTNVYENYARIISSQINSLYRVSSEVSLIAVEEQRYYEFKNALSDNDVLMLANISLPEISKNPPAIIHIAPELVVDMIDRMLGGMGDDTSINSDYIYTDIEKGLYKTISRYIVNAMTDSWGNYVKLVASFQQMEENPSMMQTIGLDEVVVLCVLSVTMKNVVGKITICLPGVLLDNVFTIFEKRANMNREEMADAEENKIRIMDSIKDSPLEIRAQLGDALVSLDDVYNLHIGDVVNLNKPKDSEVSLFIEGNPWFSGKVGVQNKNLAVEISDVFEDILTDIENKETVER